MSSPTEYVPPIVATGGRVGGVGGVGGRGGQCGGVGEGG